MKKPKSALKQKLTTTDVKYYITWLRSELRELKGEPLGVLFGFLPNTMLEDELKALKLACRKLNLVLTIDNTGRGSVTKQ